MYQDGGGKMAAALKPIRGGEKISKFLDAVMRLDAEAIFDIKPVWVNGARAVLIFRNNLLDSVFTLEVEKDKISEMFFLRNPDKVLLT